jgi:MFS family permease
MDNRRRLFVASFMSLIAVGMAFSIRGSILGDWAAQFGFTRSELGSITGMGLVGFGVTIILFSTIADRIGYGALMAVAFVLFAVSSAVTLLATPIFHAYGRGGAYWCLYIGMFLFSLGHGTCEAVINPLTATLYEKEKTHYLNILHAGWPGGLVLGATIAVFLTGHVRWEIQWSLFLVPTVIFGAMLLGQKFPATPARAAGLRFRDALVAVMHPVFLVLVVLHALIGYVELGTDSWITKITGEILASPRKGLLLFIYTSSLMFGLRFVAGPIVHRISSLGLLLASSVIGATGLTLIGGAGTGVACVLATTVYALGKTFLWPTMLGVVSDRFPRGGALSLGVVGGVGMISAGLLGGPGIGYKQDYYAAQRLRGSAPAVFEKYASPDTRQFLVFPAISGLDGTKVAAVTEKAETALTPVEREEKRLVADATLFGSRMALRWTALVPALMAVGYFGLLVTGSGRRREEDAVPAVSAAAGQG